MEIMKQHDSHIMAYYIKQVDEELSKVWESQKEYFLAWMSTPNPLIKALGGDKD